MEDLSTDQSVQFAKKVLAVIGEVKRVAKTGYNEFHKYKFVEDAAVVRAIRDAMVANGLLVRPVRFSHEQVPAAETAKGKSQVRTVLKVHWVLTDATTGYDEHVHDFPSEGLDGEDKGTPKALTANRKAFLLNYFMVEQGGDPENYSDEPAKSLNEIIYELFGDDSAAVAKQIKKKFPNIEDFEAIVHDQKLDTREKITAYLEKA